MYCFIAEHLKQRIYSERQYTYGVLIHLHVSLYPDFNPCSRLNSSSRLCGFNKIVRKLIFHALP